MPEQGAPRPRSSHDTPFLRPLWRRVALVGFCLAWSAWEFHGGETLWATIAGGMALYGAWIYLISWRPAEDEQPRKD